MASQDCPGGNCSLQLSNGTEEFMCVTYEEYQALINQTNDWTSLTRVRALFIGFYSLVFVLSFSGNLFVIVTIARHKSLHTVRNMFIVNLSTSDFLVTLTSLPLTSYTSMFKYWIFGRPLCYIIALLQAMSVNISSFTLTAVAIDRYILIVHPATPPIRLNVAVGLICGIWGTALFVSTPSVIHYHYFEPHVTSVCGYFCNENWTNLQLRRIYGVAIMVWQFAVPLLLIAFCYSRILQQMGRGYAVRAARTRKDEGRSERQTAALKRQRKTNKMLIAMVVAFALSWAPFVLFNSILDSGISISFVQTQPFFCGALAHCIAMTSTFWNPILYGYMNETFRHALWQACPCMARLLKSNQKVEYTQMSTATTTQLIRHGLLERKVTGLSKSKSKSNRSKTNSHNTVTLLARPSFQEEASTFSTYPD